ncbi:hypothetical protein DD238_004615 [Peronospora effusa]|uniref:Nucleolar protein 11 C-terminal domain-containing protein n=1 Tax=Peronospora effusa TaxID=542832 RepID=A0A3M6VE68_9STRA|nr:hypothetical protein DD238_004615 [Peronospora effusa]
MELDQAISLWRGRAADATLLGATTCVSKDSNRLVLLTSAEDVREICAPTRKCINHWTFRAGSAHALHVAAVRHAHSRLFFGVCGAPGVSESKKARQARRQEDNKTTTLPANEGLTVWRDTDLDVAKWRRAPLHSSCKVFTLLTHVKLKEEVIVVFQDGSFVAYDEDLNRGVHSDDVKEAVAVEGDEDEDDDQEEAVMWAYLETDNRSSLKGGLFLSILLHKSDKQLELLVYQITFPSTTRRMGGVLSVVLLIRHRVVLPDNEDLSSCAFHPETFSYSLIGRSGCWQSLRFSRDALTNAVTLVASHQMPNLGSAEADSSPVHKKRKLQAVNKAGSGYLVSGIGHATYLISLSLDAPLKITAWDSKFAVPVSRTEINVATENDNESSVVIGRSSRDGVGKPIQIVNVGTGDAVFAIYERSAFLIHVRNKNSTLASVLGATASSDLTSSKHLATPAMPNSVIQWKNVTATSSVNNDILDAETWKSNMCSDDDYERQLIADLLNPQVTATATEFTNRLGKALMKLKTKRTKCKDENELSYRLLQAVTQRCLNSTDLGLWTTLEQMLLTDRLSARAEPTLLPTLMKHNQFALLECAMVHLIDIDERSIVRLLKYFIHKSSSPSFIKFVTKQVKVQNKKASKEVDAIAACERYAVALLGLPTNSVFLHRAIREFKLEEVLLLLAICKKLLLVHTTGDDGDDEEEPIEKPKKSADKTTIAEKKNATHFTPLPSASHCCMWICALLDAHLLALIQRASQNSEICRTLHQLNELVQLLVRTNAQYESVHGVLSNFLSGVRLPQAPGLSDYTIEELRL